MTQLAQVVAAAGVDGPIVQQEGRVFAATANVAHSLPVKKVTPPRLNYNLFVDPAQAELSIGGVSPTQHGGSRRAAGYTSPCKSNIITAS